MPVPTQLSDLNVTAASNSPAATDTISSTDDYLRALSSILARISAGTDPLVSPAISGELTNTATSALQVPSGTQAQRPTGAKGKIRFNDDTDLYEGYDGTAWSSLGGAQAGGAIYENSTTISANYTLTSSKNGFSVGPITINSGISVTVGSGQRWVVL